jgi:2',3'-cyclic-nucleotide 2'-phosphodiesterase (5'-nucleotidase family)
MAITIFHTADLHNRLTPAAARQLAGLKRQHPGSLLLDAGDAVAAGNLTYRMTGEPVLRAMAELGYSAMAMGNRESHPFRRALERKLRDASFPVLAANIRNRRRGEESRSRGVEHRPFEGPEIVRSHLLLSVPGARVGVIGFAPQMVRPSSLWARVTDYVFEDPMAIAPELAARLRAEADLVVCLSHASEDKNRQLAALPEVDLVLAGHSHRVGVTAEPGCALIVSPGRHGSHAAKTELTSRADARSELIPLERGR